MRYVPVSGLEHVEDADLSGGDDDAPFAPLTFMLKICRSNAQSRSH